MLLRQISEHVKNQNWSAIVIDFTIVVFGILLAFQITEWNQGRKDSVLEREYLQRVIQDLEGDAKSLETAMVLANSRAAAMNLLLNLHNDVQAATDNMCAYLIGLTTVSIATLRPSLNQTHAEMVTSGNLSLLRSNDVKNRLGIYYNSYQDLNDSVPRIVQRIAPLAVMQRNHTPVALGQALNQTYSQILNKDTVGVDSVTAQLGDLSKLSLCTSYTDEFVTFYISINKDPEYYGLLQGAEAVQLFMAGIIRNLLASNRSLRELIEAELGER